MIALMYHRINDKLPAGEFVVHPAEFETQMSFLAANPKEFQIVGLDKALVSITRQHDNATTRQPKATILITFDDGYRDNYINAFPVLKKYGFPALIFLITDYIGTGYKRPRYQGVPWKRDYLSPEEIAEMARRGIEFGAHTATHPRLTGIGIRDAKNEIAVSRDKVAELAGKQPAAFSYPYGAFSSQIKTEVKKSGFACAFTTISGANAPGDDMFGLKRVDVRGGEGFGHFKNKVGAYE